MSGISKSTTTGLLIAIATAYALAAAACSNGSAASERTEGGIIAETGTVKYINLEGGFYGIIGDSGVRYDPTNLQKEFKVDGLRVRFTAKHQTSAVSFHMWGTLIDIISIEKLQAH
ncbi:MAG: hypothetical protein AB1553_14305 [Nitrospirota bacterium]